jgi:hypothetical protein
MLLNIRLCGGADTVTQGFREWPINCHSQDKSEDGTGYLKKFQTCPALFGDGKWVLLFVAAT